MTVKNFIQSNNVAYRTTIGNILSEQREFNNSKDAIIAYQITAFYEMFAIDNCNETLFVNFDPLSKSITQIDLRVGIGHKLFLAEFHPEFFSAIPDFTQNMEAFKMITMTYESLYHGNFANHEIYYNIALLPTCETMRQLVINSMEGEEPHTPEQPELSPVNNITE